MNFDLHLVHSGPFCCMCSLQAVTPSGDVWRGVDGLAALSARLESPGLGSILPVAEEASGRRALPGTGTDGILMVGKEWRNMDTS